MPKEIVELTGATEIHAGPYQPLGKPFLDGIATFGLRGRLDVQAVSDLVQAVSQNDSDRPVVNPIASP